MSEQQQGLRGVIKPNGEYLVHFRAGVEFPKYGREFVVDDDAAEKASAPVNAKGEKGEPTAPSQHHERMDSEGKKERLPIRIVDKPGKPLVLSAGAYEYMKEAFGKQLVCEPLGGGTMDAATFEKAGALQAENERLKARIAELEAAGKKQPQHQGKRGAEE